MPTPDDGSLFYLSDSTQPISVIPRQESKQHNSNHEPKRNQSEEDTEVIQYIFMVFARVERLHEDIRVNV